MTQSLPGTITAEAVVEPRAHPLMHIKRATKTPEGRLGMEEVLRMVGISRTTMWRYVMTGKFPPPIVIGGRHSWDADDVLDWIGRPQPKATPRPNAEPTKV